LADHPSFLPSLARWHHDQWSYLDVAVSAEERMAALGKHGKAQVPTTVIALSGDCLLGSASLIAHDMDTHPELSPWLASVYVAPEYRRCGIGRALVQRIVAEAASLGIDNLYLFTPDKERFYTRLGWAVLERTMYRGYAQVVMVRHIADRPPEDH
jgi:GNAT superfamily N-acetyltransferase